MTVAELIAKLQTLPQHALVVGDVWDYGQDDMWFVGLVKSVKGNFTHDHGPYLVDEDEQNLILRASMHPDFPTDAMVADVVHLSARGNCEFELPANLDELVADIPKGSNDDDYPWPQDEVFPTEGEGRQDKLLHDALDED